MIPESFKGRKVFQVTSHGRVVPVVLVARKYVGGNFAVTVEELVSENGDTWLEPYGTLTVNLPDFTFKDKTNVAFVKCYSENADWWKQLTDLVAEPVKTIHNIPFVLKDTHVDYPLYHFFPERFKVAR